MPQANTRRSAAAAREELVESLRQVIADAEDLLGATADETGTKIEKLRERAEDNLVAARKRLGEAEGQLRETARHAADLTEEYVHENPWSALGFAAAAGMFLGVLLGRR